ncbi:MAG: hypothetical protein ACYTXI_39580 [Nostoc sp.]
MINSKPKSAVVERMGCDSVVLSATSRRSVYARQLCAVASGNFRNILSSGLPTQKCWVRIGQREKGKGIKYLYPAKVTWLTTRATDLLLLISPALFLGIDITLNPSLSKEFQGESR